MIRLASCLFILLATAGRAAASPSPQPVAMLNGSGGNIVCFSGDGSRILTAGKDEARVWDASTFRPVSDPIKNLEDITCAAISSDGSASSIGGGTVARVWDAATGRPITEELRHGGSGAITALSSLFAGWKADRGSRWKGNSDLENPGNSVTFPAACGHAHFSLARYAGRGLGWADEYAVFFA